MVQRTRLFGQNDRIVCATRKRVRAQSVVREAPTTRRRRIGEGVLLGQGLSNRAASCARTHVLCCGCTASETRASARADSAGDIEES